MTEKDALMGDVATNLTTAFGVLKAHRHVSESYGASVVVIACEHCHVMWERDKKDGRRVTVADRSIAVVHLKTVHGIGAAMYDAPEAAPSASAGSEAK